MRATSILRCRFPALRFHPALFYRDAGGVRRLPALLAAVTGGNAGEHPGQTAITGVHRTWLDPARPAKAAVARPRKALGRVHGCAVTFVRMDTAMLPVGEGIETVLSLLTALPDTVAAAALSAGSLGAFAPPAGIRRLVIARAGDPEGDRAAARLLRRCRDLGIQATVIAPEHGDFNDDLVALGRHSLAARIAPFMAASEVPARPQVTACGRERSSPS